MIPDYQTLMGPVLQLAEQREYSIGEAINVLADQMRLSDAERSELLPSGKQAIFANRVHWAKTYLKQAGLIKYTRRGHFQITDAGRLAIQSSERIDNQFLSKFDAFVDFKMRRSADPDEVNCEVDNITSRRESKANLADATPDEVIRVAYSRINNALAKDILDQLVDSTPAFFEQVIVDLFLAMGYGGSSEDAGRALGRSGDDGVDGVIDQDPLGVDQIYLQAKRYKQSNVIGPGAIRDFFGALSLKRASKGIFVTTSSFSSSATQTAQNIGSRIVLIDGESLGELMIRYGIGCREVETLSIKRLDDDYFQDSQV